MNYMLCACEDCWKMFVTSPLDVVENSGGSWAAPEVSFRWGICRECQAKREAKASQSEVADTEVR